MYVLYITMNFEDKGRILALLKNDDEKDRKKWEKLYLTSTPHQQSANTKRPPRNQNDDLY